MGDKERNQNQNEMKDESLDIEDADKLKDGQTEIHSLKKDKDGKKRLCSFDENEIILTKWEQQWYIAKVLSIKKRNKKQYKVHYLGYNARWDRYVEEEECLKYSPENLRKYKANIHKVDDIMFQYIKVKDVYDGESIDCDRCQQQVPPKGMVYHCDFKHTAIKPYDLCTVCANNEHHEQQPP